MVKAFGCVMSNLPKRARTKKNKINEVWRYGDGTFNGYTVGMEM